MKAELPRHISRINFPALNNGLSQRKCHVCIVGVPSRKFFPKNAHVEHRSIWVHPFEARSKGISQKTAEHGSSEFVAKDVTRQGHLQIPKFQMSRFARSDESQVNQ